MDRLTDAERALAETCWPLAYALALRRWLRYGGDLDDLVSAAAEALVRAAQDYDPARGAFTTAAQTYVVNELRAVSRNTTPLFGPRPHACRFNGTPPRPRVPFDAATHSRDVSPPDAAIAAEQRDLVRAAIATLPAEQQAAVRAVHCEGQRRKHFAAAYGVPRSRAEKWLWSAKITLTRLLRVRDFE